MKLHVVTISFNQAEFLPEAIESVRLREGSRHSLRYTVVDPGSEDGSRGIIEDCRPPVTDVVFEQDRGPADGLNKGFEGSEADILAYINADDRFLPGALDWAADHLDSHPEVDVVCGACRLIDAAGRPRLRKRLSSRFDLRDYMDQNCLIIQQATFFRRSAFMAAGGFNPANRTCWDAELVVDMAIAGARVASVRKLLGDFRIWGNTITAGLMQGSYSSAWLRDHARINRKIERHTGCRRRRGWSRRLRQVAYRLSPSRRIGEFLVR